MSEPKKITELWAWIGTEADGGEGIPAMKMGDTMMPLIGADEERIRSLAPHAKMISEQAGVPIRLVRFTQMEEVECDVS